MEFMSGKDVFCFPSYCSYWQWQILCYCILPLAFDIVKKGDSKYIFTSIVLVVSPFIVLMKDKVRAMQEESFFEKQLNVKYVLASIS